MINKSITISIFFMLCANFGNAQTTNSETWELNSIAEINGHGVEVTGNPELVETEVGTVMEFDGDGDRILVDSNPIGDSEEFTVEVIFKPDAGINKTNEPRFIHIMDPNDADEKRLLIELRVNNNNEMYLDGFMKTDSDNLALIDETKTHPTNEWMHAAVTYKDNTFSTYINGELELTGTVSYTTSIINLTGKTSIGGRMNERNWFKGQIKSLKITDKALPTDEFTMLNNTSVALQQSELFLFKQTARNVEIQALGELTGNTSFQVINIAGIKVYSTHTNLLESESILIPTVNLPSGIYIVKAQNKNQLYTNKFYKN